MAEIRLVNLSKRWGAVTGVRSCNLHIADGEFLVLLGPSGCGKTTTMRMIAGLEDVTEGEIRIGDRLVNHLDPKDRDIAMVFQSYGLYPTMTVYENIRFPLKVRKIPEADHHDRVMRAAKTVELTELLDRKPAALSGGQRQRVALARAIVRKPKVFLMDEPLSNLDAKLRVSTRAQIKNLHHELKTTTIYVTHDQLEAMTLADQLVVMNKGQVEQAGAPLELYEKPQTIFVAGFIGAPPMNLITVPDGGMPGLTLRQRPAGVVVLGVRPEHLHEDGSDSSELAIDIVVSAVEAVGAETYLYGALNGDGPELIVRVPGRAAHAPGQRLKATAAAAQLHFFNPETGRRIG
ncbi:MAG: sn-glycerol-3-phosphate ABC transporter ATP-binding protein UgpC [Methylobacterium sp.]|nr:sn-glycerol-3-phosphate ABC transporter ATP-binding protein UgpC [Methylobacterium sp.]